MEIKLLGSGDKEYDKLDQLIEAESTNRGRTTSTSFYNGLVKTYNELEVGQIMEMTLPTNIRHHNLTSVLRNRGLGEEDFRIARRKLDDEGYLLPRGSWPTLIKKLSPVSARIIDYGSIPSQDVDSTDE